MPVLPMGQAGWHCLCWGQGGLSVRAQADSQENQGGQGCSEGGSGGQLAVQGFPAGGSAGGLAALGGAHLGSAHLGGISLPALFTFSPKHVRYNKSL